MSVRADPEEEAPPTMDEEEEEEGEKMQANPTYLPIKISYYIVTREQVLLMCQLRDTYLCVYVVAIASEVSCIMFAYTTPRGGTYIALCYNM